MNRKILKLLLISLFLSAVLAFFVLDLKQYVSLDYIKMQQNTMLEYYENNRFLVLTVFASIYVLVTALSLPAATILTLLGGALFGLPMGLLIVSFSSTTGATLAFLMSRFLMRDYVQKNYSKQLDKVNMGFAKEGAFYLFALRLVPAVPFFVVNIVMGLMPISVKAFYLVSQLGMLPATAVYVYAGTQLVNIKSLSDIASPSLLLAFTLLGVFPIVAKKMVGIIRKEKVNE